MKVQKRLLLASAAVAAIGVTTIGGVGMVSAATTSTGDNTGTSVIDKIASKFNLQKADVQAVFDADRAEHKTEMQVKQKERMAQAVTDGKLTQDQSDYITKAMAEIESLRGDGKPGQESDGVRQQIKTKMEALRTWATDNKIDMSYAGPGGRGGYGPMGNMGERPTDAPADSSVTN